MNILKEYTVKHTNKNFYLLTTIILSIFFSQIAHASFLVEPHLSSITAKFTRGDKEGDVSGEVSGLRLGYSDTNFMIGLNFEKGHYTYDSNLTDNAYSHFSGGGVGTFIGFHFFERVRIWSGYLNSALESNTNSSQRFFGQQVEIGVGYRVWQNILINYSYFNNYFTQEESDITGKTGSIDEVIRVVGSNISVSAIFIF